MKYLLAVKRCASLTIICAPVGPWRSWARAIFKRSRVFGLGFLSLRASLLQPSHVNPVLKSVNKFHLLGKADFGDLLTGGFWSPPALCASLFLPGQGGSASRIKVKPRKLCGNWLSPSPLLSRCISLPAIQAVGSPPRPCPATQSPLHLLGGGVRSLTSRDLQLPVFR